MLVAHAALAAAAVALLAWKPRSACSAAAVAFVACAEVALGAGAGPTVSVVVPLAAFLTAALSPAAPVVRSGLVDTTAAALARVARGCTDALFLLV